MSKGDLTEKVKKRDRAHDKTCALSIEGFLKLKNQILGSILCYLIKNGGNESFKVRNIRNIRSDKYKLICIS